ncbi:energy-coupling factor transporter transmembrane component T family protein [Blastochloris viridis]|uniref:Transmembrane component BioN of energizing module of biotin ECF transporter n=1 Tax=Blastochloris viridis TaxID=1079 RepID=A0A182CYT5_BLAVI|nr:energy-coupling factor transporter transmembrane protein EcfT [Blastochloris viridis]ALK08347.1 Energy-coupling factor transporter transmembrane protein BioN [Blastochloris viridis]BAR98380.1 transmembrane component BioN of energizing module of biotin ECF transporter [Blastochloris viridis]
MTPLYFPGDSVLHRAPAGVKLLALAGLGTALFLTTALWILVPAAVVAAAVLAALRPPRERVRRQLAGVAVLIAVVAVLAALSSGLHHGAVVASRFSALVVAALVVTLSTRSADMLEAIERALAPLDRRGLVDAARVSLAVSLVLRFVPGILGHYREVREAQAARGLDANPLALIVPLVVRTLKDADDVAAAIEARGFPPARAGD